MDRTMTGILAELGRWLATLSDVAARNIAEDMLGREVLAEWLALYPDLPVGESREVLVIMAGNIPFVGLHDLICVLAAGHRAMVKPSSRDLDNMKWVVAGLLDIDPKLPVSFFSDGSPAPEAVIAMGADDTVAAIAEKYSGVPMLLRGHRSSLAVLDGGESAGELTGLADDVLLYGGLGCRNVSLLWVPRGYDFSELRRALAGWGGSGTKASGDLRQARALLRMTGVPHLDFGQALLSGERDFSARPGILNYTFYDDPQEVRDWIAAHENEIQCVAVNSSLITLHSSLPRAVPLGRTQRPGLGDYPDGRDTMQFLSEI